MVYLQYQMNWIPSLANTPVLKTPPGTFFLGPVTWNYFQNIPLYVYIYVSVYSSSRRHYYCKQWTLCCYIKIPSISMSVIRRSPYQWHRPFCLTRWFRLNLNRRSRLDSTRLSWHDSTRWFYRNLNCRFQLDSTHCFRLDLDHFFQSDSTRCFWLNSTHGF